MLTEKQVKAIFRDAYNIYEKYKDIGTDDKKWDEAVAEFIELSKNSSGFQADMLAAVCRELGRRHE